MSNKDIELEDAVEAVCEALRPQAEIVAANTGRELASCLVSLFRPLAKSYVDPELPSATERVVDNRTRPWKAYMNFFDITEGTGTKAYHIAETDEEIYVGLQAITEAVWDYVDQIHERDNTTHYDIAALSETNMKKKMAGIRPAISRGGGTATLRIYYAIDQSHKFLCLVEVSRCEKSS